MVVIPILVLLIYSTQGIVRFSNTTGILQKKKTMWFIGVEVEQETSAPPPGKNPGSAPVDLAFSSFSTLSHNVNICLLYMFIQGYGFLWHFVSNRLTTFFLFWLKHVSFIISRNTNNRVTIVTDLANNDYFMFNYFFNSLLLKEDKFSYNLSTYGNLQLLNHIFIISLKPSVIQDLYSSV